MNGWEAESDAATLLNGLGIDRTPLSQMADLTGSQKVKVFLHRHCSVIRTSFFSMSRPTTWTCDAIEWLEEFLINFDNTVSLYPMTVIS